MYFKMCVFVISFAILSPFQANAGTATQTDWSGGDGILGPVFDWGSEFYLDTDIECYNDPSNMILGKTISPTPLEHTVDGDFDGAVSVVSADVNGDGYMDVLGAAYSAGCITWWENVDGSGTSWVEHIVDGNYDGAHRIYSADVDGDGYPDVVGCAYYTDDITWWDLRGFLSGGSLEGILADEDNYFQYRAILTTTDPLLTPTLQDVTVGWQPFTGTQEGSAGEVAQFALYGAQPNPALGHASLVFALPVNSMAELTVYDLSGRVVHSITGEYEPGLHEVILDGLASGMYMIRLTSEGFTVTRQFVVIE